MAPIAPRSAASAALIEPASGNASGKRAADDEPPAWRELRDRERRSAGNEPRERAARPAPERDQQRRKERRQDEIKSEALRFAEQRPKQVAGNGGRHPECPQGQTTPDKN